VSGSRLKAFVEHAVKSRLVTVRQVRTCRTELPEGADERALARHMVGKKLLTKYQAQRLLAGQHRGFFLDKYRILDHIATGGMGQVYRAKHSLLGRIVALKVLPRQRAARADSLERFQREGRALARLDHPNIVRTYDIGHDRNVHFLIMEYVDGDSLWRLVHKRGRLGWRQVMDVAVHVVRGLEHAWSQGIIHRDIKPGNVVVAPDGQAKVLDMGVAHLLDEVADRDESESKPRVAVGTGDYMAPEMARGADTVDYRADIYSLGCMMYFMLTGRTPFRGHTTMEKLRKHRTMKAPPIQDLAPEVPSRVAAIVRRLMSKRPDHRYASAAELLADLTGTGPIVLPEEQWLARRREAIRRARNYLVVPWWWHFRWIVPTLLCLAAILGILMVTVWQRLTP